MKPDRWPLFLTRLAARASVAAALGLGLAAAPNVAVADDGRVTARLTVSLGSGDWGFGFAAGTVPRELRPRELETTLQPRADLTAWFSGLSGRFEGLSFNGLPVVMRAPVLHVDGGESAAPGMRWDYVALGVVGVIVAALAFGDAFSDDFVDAIEQKLDEAAAN